MNDSQASGDFIAMLPLTLTLSDYSSSEKIGYLPSPLSTGDSSSNAEGTVGDITYYVPWGNLAIFYRDFTYSDDLIKLGTLDAGGADVLAAQNGDFTATFELVQ